MKLAIIGSRNCPPIDIEKQLKYIPDTIFLVVLGVLIPMQGYLLKSIT